MKRVLVVDDAMTIRLYHRSILQAQGFEVVEALNGFEGLEKLLSSRFDAALVDINMPKMDGYTFVRRLRDEPSLRALPILMISTEAQLKDRDLGILAGADFYLIKPVEPARLVASVKLMTGVSLA